MGWCSGVMGVGTKILKHGLVTQTLLCVNFIALCHKTGVFPAFVSIFTYGHESWARIERVLSEVQAEKKGFLRRVQDVTLMA